MEEYMMVETECNNNSYESSTRPSSIKRCRQCQKLRTIQYTNCGHCRQGCHKKVMNKCTIKRHQHKIAGDTHWSKLLQANDNMTLPEKSPEPKKKSAISSLINRMKVALTPKKRGRFSEGSKQGHCECNRDYARSSVSSYASSISSGISVTSRESFYEDCNSSPGFLKQVSFNIPEASLSGTCGQYAQDNRSLDNGFMWDNTRHLSGRLVSRSALIENSHYNDHGPDCLGDQLGMHYNLTTTISCPPKSIDVARQQDKDTLCNTWPPTGRKLYNLEDYDDSDSVFSEYEDDIDQLIDGNRSQEIVLRESLGDCTIPFSDIELGECLQVGRHQSVYRGKWHGEVMVHTYKHHAEKDITEFLEEVTKLSMLRHENIALFMGASIDMPNLAVVTGIRKGITLHESLHVKCDNMTLNSKMHIARQISQGMSYLHAKGVVLGHLNSRNIFMESKVKISVMDYGIPQRKHERDGYACLPKGYLDTLAPEILSSLSTECPQIGPDTRPTKEADVYAFGTLLYELVTGSYPYAGMHPQCTIWQAATGRTPPTNSLKCPQTFKSLVSSCWQLIPSCRPHFLHISNKLQKNNILHKRHSSSEPERLNLIGRSFFP